MRLWFKRQSPEERTADDLYGRVVAAARRPDFYRDWGVPDTPEARLEMVILHLFLALESLKYAPTGASQAAAGGEGLMRATIERFVTDMDDCMRELGVGDMAVPHKVKRAAAVFYANSAIYRAALATPPSAQGDALEAALAEHVYGGSGQGQPGALARHVRETFAALKGVSSDRIFAVDGAKS